MSETKEAVRSRYAGAAKQLAVLSPDSNAGCCQVDGPDCGCAGSYSADELKQIGISDAVRSEERRVGKECSSRWSRDRGEKRNQPQRSQKVDVMCTQENVVSV